MRAESKYRARNELTTSTRAAAGRSMAGRAGLIALLSAPVLLSLLLFGCPLYDPSAFVAPQSAPKDLLSSASQIILAWDPPASGTVANYIVSYRTHGTAAWTSLATVPATPQPTYTILRSAIGTGIFDFAVSAEDSSGDISILHTSLDQTADPNSGWYLSWGP
jgi:hypothetical protein